VWSSTLGWLMSVSSWSGSVVVETCVLSAIHAVPCGVWCTISALSRVIVGCVIDSVGGVRGVIVVIRVVSIIRPWTGGVWWGCDVSGTSADGMESLELCSVDGSTAECRGGGWWVRDQGLSPHSGRVGRIIGDAGFEALDCFRERTGSSECSDGCQRATLRVAASLPEQRLVPLSPLTRHDAVQLGDLASQKEGHSTGDD
jgi:hypothetical protein